MKAQSSNFSIWLSTFVLSYEYALLCKKYSITASRIAHGVPVGGGLEYVDGTTLARSFEGRTKL